MQSVHRPYWLVASMGLVVGLTGFVIKDIVDEKRAAKEKLSLIIGQALAGGAQVVHLGDVDHTKNGPLMQLLSRPWMMRRIRESGVTAIGLEAPAFEQYLAGALARGQISAWAYAKTMAERGYLNSNDADPESARINEAKIVIAAAKVGLRVYFMNPGNGNNEYAAYARALQVARLNGPFENFGPEGERDVRYPRLSNAERQKIEALFQAFDIARRDDSKLATELARLVGRGEKILLVYGSGHGDQSHDLNELLAEKGIGLVRIDVYPNRRGFESKDDYQTDPPEGEYILSEHKLIPPSHFPAGEKVPSL